MLATNVTYASVVDFHLAATPGGRLTCSSVRRAQAYASFEVCLRSKSRLVFILFEFRSVSEQHECAHIQYS